MLTLLTIETLKAMDLQFAVLGVHNYALLVRFQIREQKVECLVPTWIGLEELLEQTKEVTLAVVERLEPSPRWLFLKGFGSIAKNPDWMDLIPAIPDKVNPEDLYQVLRIEPKRMELLDDEQGWGVRQTADF